MKFSTKLIIIVLGIIISFTSIISYIVYTSNIKILQNEIQDKLENTALHIMDKVDRMLFEGCADIKVIAQDSLIKSRGSTPQQILERLTAYNASHEDYISLSFFDVNRMRIADTAGLDIGIKQPLEGYWKDPLLYDEITISVSESKSLKQNVIYFTHPMKDNNGETFGIIVARMPIRHLNYTMAGVGILQEYKKLRINLIDKNGNLLYSNYNGKEILKDHFTSWESLKRSLAGEKMGSVPRHLHPGGEETIDVFVHQQGYLDFKGDDWTLVIDIPTKAAFAPIVTLRNAILYALLVSLALSVLIVLYFSRTISRPIATLTKGAEIIGKGDLEHKIDIRSKDEIGALAAAFNEMVENRAQAESALQRSEEEIKATLQCTGDAMRVVSEDFTIVRVNNEMGKLSGINEQESIGMRCYEQLGGEFCHTDGCTLRRILAGEERVQLETLKETRDGKKVPVEIIATPLKVRGKTTGTVEAYRDITDRKKAENALIQKTLELQRSNKELEQFAYVASHDLQEPLRKIVGFTELIKERYKGKLDAEADEYIMYTVDGAMRMQGLINDLLNYSRVGRGNFPLENRNIEEILDEALANLERTIKESGAKITHNSLPVLRVNASRMRQVFQNLISNAIKFSKKEEIPYVHISVEKKEEMWTFAVRDNGIGIDPQYAERIFQIFQRLHTRAEYSGSGIGLAICKKIVELHEGKIWMESKQGEGATFYFTIPA
ncbi:MAG: ATP-binding protein [bacterium]